MRALLLLLLPVLGHAATPSYTYVDDSIRAGSVTTTKLGDGSVTTQKLHPDAVTEEKILDGSITTRKIDDDTYAVLTAGGSIADGAVTTDKIAGGAVTTGKIHPDAVTNTAILNGAITTAKLDSELYTELSGGGVENPMTEQLDAAGNNIVNIGSSTHFGTLDHESNITSGDTAWYFHQDATYNSETQGEGLFEIERTGNGTLLHLETTGRTNTGAISFNTTQTWGSMLMFEARRTGSGAGNDGDSFDYRHYHTDSSGNDNWATRVEHALKDVQGGQERGRWAVSVSSVTNVYEIITADYGDDDERPEVVINEHGGAVDFRVETDSQISMFVVDGTEDLVKIGADASRSTFTANGRYAQTVEPDCNAATPDSFGQFCIENDASHPLFVATGTTPGAFAFVYNDGYPSAQIYISTDTSASTTITANVFASIAGTCGFSGTGFTESAECTIRYDGDISRNFVIDGSLCMSKGAGGTSDVYFRIGKNSDPDATVSQQQQTGPRTVTSTNAGCLSIHNILHLSQNDTIQVYVTTDSGDDVTVDSLSLIVY